MKLDETGADGLVPISSLGNEYFRHDPDSQTLTGERSRRVIGLGQRVTVRLAEAAPITGGLLFELLEVEGRRMPTPPRRASAEPPAPQARPAPHSSAPRTTGATGGADHGTRFVTGLGAGAGLRDPRRLARCDGSARPLQKRQDQGDVQMTRTFGLAALVLRRHPRPAPPRRRPPMSFFVTSANPGKGGDLGGLAGADAWCATLAEAAGVTGRTWRAYLSTAAENARDRIGSGPWYNAKGEKIADDVASLHGDANASPRPPPSTRRATSSTAVATRPTATTS